MATSASSFSTHVQPFVFIILWTHLIIAVYGGTCWLRADESGFCHGAKRRDVSQEECCSGEQPSLGWTEQDYSDGRLFYYTYISDQGAPQCIPCHRTCDNVYCGGDKKCRMRDGVARCMCSPDCSDHTAEQRGPLCGTDGHTYKSYCALLRSNCRRERYAEVDYYGSRCQYSCDNVQCPSGKSCITDQNGIPHCIPCNAHQRCSESPAEKICGADSITYHSMCHFKVASCLNGKSIGIAYRGQCQGSHTCESISCEPGLTCLWNAQRNIPQCARCNLRNCASRLGGNPVCGTDGNTYASYCEMQEFACVTGLYITTAHYGECGTNPADGHQLIDDEDSVHGDDAYYYAD